MSNEARDEQSEWIDVEFVSCNELSVLVNDGDANYFIPRSLIIDQSEEFHNLELGNALELELPIWFLEKEGLV